MRNFYENFDNKFVLNYFSQYLTFQIITLKLLHEYKFKSNLFLFFRIKMVQIERRMTSIRNSIQNVQNGFRRSPK